MFMQKNDYDEDFKKSIVSLCHNEKSQTQLIVNDFNNFIIKMSIMKLSSHSDF